MKGRLIALALLLAAGGCSASGAESPACTNEAALRPFGDAGVVPPRSLPAGYPCAAEAVCSALVDECLGEWPDAAAVPASTSSTPFTCECLGGVWTCGAASASAAACLPTVVPVDAGGD